MPTDQEEAPAWQRQYGPGAERDSWSCLGMASRIREWDMLGRDRFPVLYGLIEHDQKLELNWIKITLDNFENNQ